MPPTLKLQNLIMFPSTGLWIVLAWNGATHVQSFSLYKTTELLLLRKPDLQEESSRPSQTLDRGLHKFLSQVLNHQEIKIATKENSKVKYNLNK